MSCTTSFIAILFLIYKFKANAEESCILDLNDRFSLPQDIPHILTLDGKFYQSTNSIIKIEHGNKAIMSCRSKFLTNFEEYHDVTITCKKGSMVLDSDNTTKMFSDLGCTDPIIEEVQMDVYKCKNMEGSHFLYKDLARNRLINLAELCYDSKVKRFAFIRTYLSEIYPASELEDRKLPLNIHLLSRLFKIYDSLNYIKIDNSEKPLDKFVNIESNLYFIATKLSPMNILFDNAQFDFTNSFIAMWKTIAEGNWNRLMSDIKLLSKDQHNTLEVIIGTHETLVLGGKKQFMKGDEFPIPKYTWAIISDNTTNSAVALITINNPLLTLDQVKEQTFCNNICDKIHWARELLRNKNNEKISDGYTFCCSIETFNIFPLDYPSINLLV